MSCNACNDAQDNADVPGGGSYYFRWKNANLQVRGCREHVTQVFDVLRAAQKKEADNAT